MLELNLSTVLEGVILMLMVGIFQLIFSIREHLAKLNGRVGRTELAMELHVKVDDERYLSCNANARDLWDAIRK